MQPMTLPEPSVVLLILAVYVAVVLHSVDVNGRMQRLRRGAPVAVAPL
jgi:hypothetical protein